MERFTISKSEKQTIYEIYRACRICGAGGGYRMPIVQNIVDLETSDVELRQKIQECLQLEVRLDDRMPPLICELCVDKVNDFYEFLELSRQTNIRTRTRLGLPLQTARKGESDPGDCILGVTEPLIVDEPAKRSTAGPKCSKKIKKETENVKVKVETAVPSPVESRSSSVSSRSSRTSRRAPTPPRPTRAQSKTDTLKPVQVTQETRRGKEKEVKECERRGVSRKELQSLLQDNQKYDDNSLLMPRSLKRREEPPKPVIVPKRTRTTTREPVKEPVKEPTPPPPSRVKPGPKSRKILQERLPPPSDEPKDIPVPLRIPKPKAKGPLTPPKLEVSPQSKSDLSCLICGFEAGNYGGLCKHLRIHTPTYTRPQNACNPCGKWFVTADEAAAHHRYHRAATFPYHCRGCFDDYRSLQDYNDHILNSQCVPHNEVPDVKCERCWKTFITHTMFEAHKCQGPDGRPGGNCSRCSRPYATVKTLRMHQKVCTQKKKRDLIADPDVLRRLKPMQVRISRCDDLLTNPTGDGYDVSTVKPNHGLDKNYLYPYIKLKPVKPKPRSYGRLVMRGPIKEKVERDSYTHWDSEDSDSGSVIKKVDNLTTLCLKKLFSKNMLGKVPRKLKSVKNDLFDSVNDFGNMSTDINDIISSLNDDLRNDCVPRNRKDSLIAIAINDIIGVPNCFGSNDVSLGNDNVARNENSDVQINDRNDNDTPLNAKNEKTSESDNLKKDLNDAEIENQGTNTVDSVSDISTELNLIESEDQENTRNEVDSENVDNEETNDLKTQDDTNDEQNKGSEIRNIESVDVHDLIKQSDHLGTEINYASTKLNDSEILNDNLDSQNNYNNMDVSNDSETQNKRNEDEKPNNESKLRNDNLDTEINDDSMDINNDSEPQNKSNEDEKPNNESKLRNDTLDTEINDDSMDINNDSEPQNKSNEDEKSNNESELRNDTLDSEINDDSMDINNDTEAQNNFNEDEKLTNESELRNDNLDTEINDDSMDINNDSETRTLTNQNEEPSKESKLRNDKLDTVINDDSMVINNDSEQRNKKFEDEKPNDESDLRNDNFETKHLDPENNRDDIEKINVPDKITNNEDIKLSSESSVQNSNFNTNPLDTVNSYINSETNRIETDIKNSIIIQETLEEQSSVEKHNSIAIEKTIVNGTHESNSKTNHNFTETEKSDETNTVAKESPIKHSIDNLIGDTVKNPDKYIDEVISSIEDIIKINEDIKAKNRETNAQQIDDQNLMDAIDAQIGEDKDKIDNDKITLDDLLPKEDRSLELDDISDDDFDFDP